MKVSINLIRHINQHYGCGVDPYTYGVDEILQRIGAQLGAVEDVTYYGKRFDGVVVAKVIACEPHDNSDHLSVCLVDDGGVVDGLERNSDGLVQVVCGAPNVRAELTVAWIPPQVTVPSTIDKDPFVLSVREIRGKVSNGMLASPAELGLSDNHDGILEIDVAEVGEELATPGTPFRDLYDLDDVIIDCENKMFTHRPDCFGTLGVAREIAGIFGDNYTSPEWYKERLVNEVTTSLPMSVENQAPDLVSRFMMQAVSDITVRQSPMWMQAYLARVGMNSINNVVDCSNYFMMLTAQPTHAFDYDKVVALCGENPVFAPRMARAGEKIALLNGKTIKLTDQDMVITANDRPIALAGIMGGSETEVDTTTKNIVIECATFDMYAVRKVSMRHGLFTDAVTRYTKGQSPLQNDRVLAKFVDELVSFAGGKVASEVFDSALKVNDVQGENTSKVLSFPDDSKLPMTGAMETSVKFINDRLGLNLTIEEIIQLLTKVEFEAYQKDEESLFYWAPFWRMDIEIAEDIVEEIGRLYGYDKLPVALPVRSSKPTPRNEGIDFARSLRNTLQKAGANEILTYSFAHGDLLKNVGIDPETSTFHLRNALSPDLQYFRPSLLPSLLAKVRANVKAQAGTDDNEFALYEIGKVHERGIMEEDEPNLPMQQRRISLVYTADGKAAAKHEGAAYYQAKLYLDKITNGQAEYLPLDTNEYAISAPFQMGRAAIVQVDGRMIGIIGEFRHQVKAKLKLPDFCAGFEVDIDSLRTRVKKTIYQPLSTYPSSQQDVTFEVSDDLSWHQLEQLLHAELAVAKAEQGYLYELKPLDIYKAEGSDKKRVSFRLTLAHYEKTLKTSEINELLEVIAKALKRNAQAERI